MTFAEMARHTGEPLRSVEFDLHPRDVPILRKLKGFELFDPRTETLRMIKPIYGLKDAPRAWRQKLRKVLSDFGLKQLIAEGEIYVRHQEERKKQKFSKD